jgi:tRNA (cmo5U34)-methyltransferase
VVKHDLEIPLPADTLGSFDLVVSGLAIHHLNYERKKQLIPKYSIYDPNGVFLNLEQVASSTEALHQKLLAFVGLTPTRDDPLNKLLDLETQLAWLRELGFKDVDCFWK